MINRPSIQAAQKLSAGKWRQYTMLFVLLSPVFAKAQRERMTANLLWVGHYSTVQLNNRFSVNSDLQLRTKEWTSKWAQQLVRSGISYKVNSNFSVTAGGAWFRHAQYSGEKLFFRNEWRPWQEMSYGQKWSLLSVMQRMRLEQRFLQQVASGQTKNSYDYITRLRYRLEFQVPIKGNKVTSSLINELMVNPGYWGGEKFLDQNRTFIGVNVKVSASTMLQAQYMKIFLWRTNNILEDQNVVRLNIHQQINLKK